MPRKVGVGTQVFAGTININAPITIRVTKPGERSLLSEIIKLMETAEQGQAHYVTVADKISGWYTPVVHILAAGTFLGWWLFAHAQWQVALLNAATVLIITCPCALGLAVPVVQVLASGRLMRSGILLKSGSALERLADITDIALDKTGTLTVGKPELLQAESYTQAQLQLTASLAAHSRHPLSQAISRAYQGALLPLEVKEVPGCGLESGEIRLGKAQWCGVPSADDESLEIYLTQKNEKPVRFVFADQLRSDAKPIISVLQKHRLHTELISGDRAEVVARIAEEVGIKDAKSGLSPVEKCNHLAQRKAEGAHVLMVGDGLNDAPSLASAYVSMSPSSAMDITQNVADIVFQGERLRPIYIAWSVARLSQKLVKENFVLAIAYNIIAIPMAVMGMVTPLIAAIAMSSSSLIVIANAMRLNLTKDEV